MLTDNQVTALVFILGMFVIGFIINLAFDKFGWPD